MAADLMSASWELMPHMMRSMSCGSRSRTSSVHSIKSSHAYIQIQLQLSSSGGFRQHIRQASQQCAGPSGVGLSMNLCPDLVEARVTAAKPFRGCDEQKDTDQGGIERAA